MGETAKYMFDRNFDAEAINADPPEVVVERELRRQFEQELEAARQTAYEHGRTDGKHEALGSLEAKTNETLEQLIGQANAILGKLDDDRQSIRAEAVQVALAAAEQLAGELLQRDPTTLLESMFSDCLEHLSEAPHIAIRVNDDLAERLQDKFREITARRGFTGKTIVLGDPETPSGDFRIEWADGGVSRDFETLRLSVNEIVKRHLGSAYIDTPGADNSATAEPDATVSLENEAPTPTGAETEIGTKAQETIHE